jgi:hypothetical protein
VRELRQKEVPPPEMSMIAASVRAVYMQCLMYTSMHCVCVCVCVCVCE